MRLEKNCIRNKRNKKVPKENYWILVSKRQRLSGYCKKNQVISEKQLETQ